MAKPCTTCLPHALIVFSTEKGNQHDSETGMRNTPSICKIKFEVQWLCLVQVGKSRYGATGVYYH